MSDSIELRRADLAALRSDEPVATGRRGIAGMVAASGLLVLAGAVFWVARPPEAPAPPARVSAPVAPIVSGPTVALTATGYVRAGRRARLSTPISGRITKVAVERGQRVEAGEVLFVLDRTEAERALAAAKAKALGGAARFEVAVAELAEQRLRHDRERGLVGAGASPKAGLEDLAARVAVLEASAHAAKADALAADAEVATLAAQLDDHRVRAPFAGVIGAEVATIGEVVGPSSALAELIDSASLRAEVDVPEAKLASAAIGAPCEIVLDAFPDRPRKGRVTAIAPELDRAKATVTIYVAFDDTNPELLPEMAARVRFFRREP
jgi:HlyD family secretion protein